MLRKPYEPCDGSEHRQQRGPGTFLSAASAMFVLNGIVSFTRWMAEMPLMTMSGRRSVGQCPGEGCTAGLLARL